MSGIDISKFKTSVRPVKKEKSGQGILDFLNKDISLSGSRLKDVQRESFYMELSILLEAGVDIKSAFELIATEQRKPSLQKLFHSIKDFVIAGGTLSEALRQTGAFSNYEYFSVQIGEETGKIITVLNDLAAFYKNKTRQRRQIIGALTYPAIVLLTSFGAIFFMLNFIVPMFSDIFKRFGGKLPYITQSIIHVSNFLKANGYIILLVMIALVIFVVSQAKKQWFRRYGAVLAMRLPVVGTLVKKIYLTRFCYSMTLLIAARIPILRALQMVKQMIGFYPIEASLDQVSEQVMQGNSLHKSLSAFTVYPPRMISLIKVGEEVNQLELFFSQIAEQYSREIEHQSSVMSSLIEPFIILILGLIVGLILIAMYLPLFQLSTVF